MCAYALWRVDAQLGGPISLLQYSFQG
jgi:hypothetical protein